MLYGVASYKRPECRTIKTLLDAGVSEKEIIVSTQTPEDYNEYKSRHKVEVIYAEKDSAAGNRNTILDYADENVILLDYDITGFSVYENGRWRIKTTEALRRIEETFGLAKQNGCCLFGVSAVSNGLTTRGRYEYDIDCLLQGTVVGVLDNTVRFDDRWKMVEDYELCLRVLRKGKRILRANYLCAEKPKNGTNTGGLHDRYAEGQLPYWIKNLAKIYKEFKPNKTMTGGQRRVV